MANRKPTVSHSTNANLRNHNVFTNMVVTMSVLLANVSVLLLSRDVEFLAIGGLEYQIPIYTRG